jgi:excinuclease UvrABC nuclease subunit
VGGFLRDLIVRRMNRDGIRYADPFAASWAVQQTLRALRRVCPYLTRSRKSTGEGGGPVPGVLCWVDCTGPV